MRLWIKYENFLKRKLSVHLKKDENLHFWQDHLFINLLLYCFPVSFLAVVPGVIMALKDGYMMIAVVDLLSLSLVTLITFSGKLSLKARKSIFIFTFYALSIFLVNSLGYIGRGVFYLFGITVFTALVFPIRLAYRTILANTVILSVFGIIIQFQLFHSALLHDYTLGKWIAFGSNVVFLSTVIVVLIHRIFDRLASVISNKDDMQRRYQSIFQHSPLPMWLFDTETLKFLEVNEAAVRHYGYTRDEFMGLTIRDIRQTEDIRLVEDVVKANQLSGRFFNGVFKHIKKNGDIIDVRIESNLITLGARQARLVLSTDITEQLKNELEIGRANLKLKESEENLRAIFESAIEGFVLLDEAFNIRALNSKARDYIKFNNNGRQFETGKNIFDFVEPLRRDHFKKMIEKVHAGHVIEYDRKYSGPKNDGYWVHYTLTPVYDNNTISGVCITGRDITAGKKYVRTIEEQNQIFQEISWMQSHLVRAPLARIMGLISLLQPLPDENESLKIINYLDMSGQELDDIIKKITHNTKKISQIAVAVEKEDFEQEAEPIN